ncbi:MAG TPA: NADH-quinone oxidoreductase subunit L [Nitriliruptorales bacterium]|nr:NADH-quinone oxidoreductase subunit L [Nitriliruptorales bacterium]
MGDVVVLAAEFELHAEPAIGIAAIAWLIPLLPLVGFVVLTFAGRGLGRRAGWLATATSSGSFVVAVGVVAQLWATHEQARTLLTAGYTWIEVGALRLTTHLLIDPLSAVMILVVTGVGSLIHLYSIGYMQGDERQGRYFAYLNLFLFSMLLLVLGANFVVLFVGWELVGLCSYLLIGFWFEEMPNAVAAKKAMVVNRIGDASFAVGLLLIFAEFGSLDFAEVLPAASDVLGEGGAATAIALLLLGGAVGKSAQIPLYVWLPDAMAGPTPVSALIHAATMVTAGVYMIARASPIYVLSELALVVVASIGVATALLAALIAIQQDDIKKVLAYSTVSQLGYMFVGVGVGAFGAGIFHLVTHAFFKGLLFLVAGSVMHAMADRTNMWRMGGLWRIMPITFWTGVVAVLTISGIPPLSGFFSKDHILAAAYEEGSTAIWAVGLVTAALTGLYMGRWLFVTFLGPKRWDAPPAGPAGDDPHTAADTEAASAAAEGTRPTEDAHAELRPHESPPVMTVPLVALAVLAAIGGVLGPTKEGPLEHWLESSVAHLPPRGGATALSEPVLIVLSLIAGLAGLGLAYVLYLRPPRRRDPVAANLGNIALAMRRGFWVDQLYDRVFVRAGGAWSRFLVWFDVTVVDGAVDGMGRFSLDTASTLRGIQTGLLRSYLAGLVLGTAALIGVFLVGAL